jgi:hypothetical protein
MREQQTARLLQLSNSTSAVATAPARAGFKRFEFYDKGSWHPYGPTAMRAVSEQYSRGQSHAYLQIAADAYFIEFERCTQSNVETGYTRSVRWESIDGERHEPASPIERDIKAVVRAMDAAAAAEVSAMPHPLPSGTAEEVSQFNDKVAFARDAFKSLEEEGLWPDGRRMFTEVELSTAEFAEVSLKLSTNMQQHSSVKMAGASLFCVHRISAESRTKRDVQELIAEQGAPALEAWHGASLDAIFNIVRAGFALRAPKNAHLYGQGVYLAPLEAAWMSCDERYAEKDARGIQHIMLCDLAQGKAELVQIGSKQFTPSAGTDFTTAVDDLSRPTRYIVWSSDMNRRILPKYVLSFSLGGTC